MSANRTCDADSSTSELKNKDTVMACRLKFPYFDDMKGSRIILVVLVVEVIVEVVVGAREPS